ncbi:MAG: hypothetical protein DCC49_05020 [Acidobacteria bacterium]|nr:MAG: hypothetical protein DCC49_05020 [Acidobacteriota bacterium]
MSSLETHPLRNLYTLGTERSRRISSWDRSGGNNDWLRIDAGATATLADIKGPGLITHIYCALAHADPFDLRDAILRMYWDDEPTPSVEVPLGDFFALPHCRIKDFASSLVTVNPGTPGSHGFNAYFPMPFATRAQIVIEHQGEAALGGVLGALWYHINYEELDQAPGAEVGRFHAQWRRETTTKSSEPKMTNRQLWPGTNLDGAENFVMLEATGAGQVVGLHLQVDNIAGGWWGEGDDMWFIDGLAWPPPIHGTGTEEIFGGGACPETEYGGPTHGFHLIEHLDGELWKGKSAMYRWFLHDPVRFSESVKATVEHGHANNFENDYAAVGYWYQAEPHSPFPALLDRDSRRPRVPAGFDDLRTSLSGLVGKVVSRHAPGTAEFERGLHGVGEAFEAVYTGDFEAAAEIAASIGDDQQ